jgi:hypothetical protein
VVWCRNIKLLAWHSFPIQLVPCSLIISNDI